MKPDGYRVKGQRQSLHLPNISVLLCLTAFSTKGSFNVQALDLSQEFKGLSLCFSLGCGLMFSLHKGKTVKLSFIYSSCCVACVCFASIFFFFPSPKFSFGGEKKRGIWTNDSLKSWWNTFHQEDFERSCTSVLYTSLEACSGFVHVLLFACFFAFNGFIL